MSEGRHLVGLLVVVSILLVGLSQVEESLGQSTETELCQPTEYAFANNSVVFTDDSCTRYDSNTEAPSGINPNEYFRCTTPSVLTDSDLGPEDALMNGATTVYTWDSQSTVLFTYDETKTFSRIVVYYYYNSTNAGLPKLTLCSQPEGTEIWSADANEGSCESIDEIAPGNGISSCDSPPCRENATANVTFNTSRVLLTIGEGKNFGLVASEVQFFVERVPESTTAMLTTDESTGTTGTTVEGTRTTDIPTTTAGTINTQQMTTTDGAARGVEQILGTLIVCASTAVVLTFTNIML